MPTPSDQRNPSRRHGSTLVPIVFYFALCVLELVAILRLNDGHLAYTLDDPYIHLALAENLAQGHYGVNATEHSAPSSSILWPFLLAPLAGGSLGPVAPLILNWVAACLTIVVFSKLAATALPDPGNTPAVRLLHPLLVCLIVLTTNLVGLAYTGMEHSLQLLTASAVILGVIQLDASRRIPWWLPAAIILGPLVRYENAAVSVIGLLYLLLTRRWKILFFTGIVTAVALLAFSAYLLSMDLYPVPTSVVSKSGPVAGKGSIAPLIRNVIENLGRTQGVLVAIGTALLIAVASQRQRTPHDRLLAACTATGLALHMVIGRFGWFHRYELYAWCVLVLALVYLQRGVLQRWIETESRAKVAALMVLIFVTTSWPYIFDLRLVPLAANNVYDQHHQMHRFATQYHQGPIAVNDIGRVTYGNQEYVLDLMGLSSIEALRAQWNSTGPEWMDELAQKHDIKLAMIYTSVFPAIPDGWTLLGTLHLSRRKITVYRESVAFYALDTAAIPGLDAAVRDFATTLPDGVRFEFATASTP